MNKQNKKLYLESLDDLGQFCYQRFAELVRQDERDKCAADYLQDCCDAVDAARLEEREACAQLCDEWFAGTAAKSIRERGKPDPAFKHFIDDKWSGIV